MPPASSAACRYGNPFRGGDNAIVRFEAGVGSSRNQANLVPYKQVSPVILSLLLEILLIIINIQVNT